MAIWIPLGCLDFINNMENGDLQRRLEFPVANWKKLVWYHMTFWSEFKYTLRPERYQEYRCVCYLKKRLLLMIGGLNYVEVGETNQW